MDQKMIKNSEVLAVKRTLNVFSWIFFPLIVLLLILSLFYFYSESIFKTPEWVNYLALFLVGGITWDTIQAFFFSHEGSPYGILYGILHRTQKNLEGKNIVNKFNYRMILLFTSVAISLIIGAAGYYFFGLHIFGFIILVDAILNLFIIRSYILYDLKKLVNPELASVVDEDDEEG